MPVTCMPCMVPYVGHVALRDTDNLKRLMVAGKVEAERPRRMVGLDRDLELEIPISAAPDD